MGDDRDTQQSVWNFDGAEMFAIFEIKKAFINCLLDWDLEGAFWKVRTLRMELDAKLKRGNKKVIDDFEDELDEQRKVKLNKKATTEKKDVDEKLGELEEARQTYNSEEYKSDESKVKFYLVLEDFYMHLCYLMKKHGIYFREGEDMRLAVLRR